ncbi:MAG: hypothetical protein ACAI43_18145 [Phycisphaerae bacterium]|nr:hypothetical protein [Tepidisphaeraceae bacterium]
MSRLRCAAVWIAAALACPALAQESPAAALPEPTPAQVAETDGIVKEIFKDDYARRGPEERRNLALKLLDEGKQTAVDTTARYVMFREARDLAASIGDAETATAAIAELGKTFKADTLDMKLKMLTGFKTGTRTADQQLASAEMAMSLIDEALAADNYPAALSFAELAGYFATAAKNPQLATATLARKADVAAQQAAATEAKAAAVKLAANPNDPAASQTVGLFLCAFKNDWDNGVPLLALSADAAWATPAKADLANPVDVDGMIKVADLWWELANKNLKLRPKILSRAEFWYNLALPKTEGTVKARLEKRIETIAAARPAGSYTGVVSEETRKLLPTPKELQTLRECAAAYKAGKYDRQGELMTIQGAIHSRLSPGLKDCAEGDFFARVRADVQVRKMLAEYGVTVIGYPLFNQFWQFAETSKSREDFASRALAFERLVAAERVMDPAALDTAMYQAIRGYASSSRELTTPALRQGFCTFLQNKGVKAGVERYRKTIVGRF